MTRVRSPRQPAADRPEVAAPARVSRSQCASEGRRTPPDRRRQTLKRILLGCLAGPAMAQPTKPPVARIGWLGGPARESAEPFVREFERGLREQGWEIGRNIVVEWRFAGGRAERLPALAEELVRLPVDLIVVPSTPPALAAKRATSTIPIVTVSVGDPVELGLVASLARPGGNITGLTATAGPEIAGKMLGLLKEAVPRAARMAVLHNPATAGNSAALEHVRAAAQTLAVPLRIEVARSAGDIAASFAAMHSDRIGALLVLGDILFLSDRARIASLALDHRLPTMFPIVEYVEAGGLMSYGPNTPDLFRRVAAHVDKILKGAKPAELPIEQPTKFELVVNRTTARALGIELPRSMQLRVDRFVG
jgi:putative tryptophan/tyrosine transport system substrate-binding protein